MGGIPLTFADTKSFFLLLQIGFACLLSHLNGSYS
ncbi:hypothetical protein CP_0227 [Chlamydia pneumoniae AR39]|uniref:Uncharacterized protein n=1 Tax=Chlamydia pneumoniae TaxID=83558 RepID=Q9K2B9_CHLPN|nr:hypothetical protein CP_0227 [Chlamydia pneumoniae AR39]